MSLGIRGLVFMSALACSTTPLWANFAVTWGAWRSMPYSIRTGFVLGAFDVMAGMIHGADPYLEANAKGLSACASGIGLSAGMMIGMIDLHYDKHHEARGSAAASVVLHIVITDVCKAFINEARAAANLAVLR